MTSQQQQFFKSRIILYQEGSIPLCEDRRNIVTVYSSSAAEHYEHVRRVLRKVQCTDSVQYHPTKSTYGIPLRQLDLLSGNNNLESCLRRIDEFAKEEPPAPDNTSAVIGTNEVDIPDPLPGMTAPFPKHATRPGNPFSGKCCNTKAFGCILDGKDGNAYCCHWKVRCNACAVDYGILHEHAVVEQSGMTELKNDTASSSRQSGQDQRRRNQKSSKNTDTKRLTSRQALDLINQLAEEGDLKGAIEVEASCKDESGAWYPSIKQGPATTFKKLKKKLNDIRNRITAQKQVNTGGGDEKGGSKNSRDGDDEGNFASRSLASFTLEGSGGSTTHISTLSFSAEDILAVSFGSRTLFWNIRSELESSSSSNSRNSASLFLDHLEDVHGTAFNLDHPRIFAVGCSERLVVYRIDMKSKTQTKLFLREAPFDNAFDRPGFYCGARICAVVFLPDRPHLVAASCQEDGLIRVCDWRTNRVVWSYGTRQFRSENTDPASISRRRNSNIVCSRSSEHMFYAGPLGTQVKVFAIPDNDIDFQLVTTVDVGQPISALAVSPYGYLSVVTSSFFNRAHLFRFFPSSPAEEMLAAGPVSDLGTETVDQLVAIPASDRCMVYASLQKSNLLEIDFPQVGQGYIRKSTGDILFHRIRDELAGDYVQRGTVAASPNLAGVFAVGVQGSVSICQVGPTYLGMASWGVAKVLLAPTGKEQEGSSFQILADKASDFVLAQIFSYVYPHSAWFDLIAAARESTVADQERQDALVEKRNARIEEVLRRRKRSLKQKEATRLARQKKHQERMNREYQKYWKKPGEIYLPESKKKSRRSNSASAITEPSTCIDVSTAGVSEAAKLLSDASTLNFALRLDETDPRWIHCKERMEERNVTMEEIKEALESGLIFPDYSHTESDSSLHRWKFYHEESGVTAITDHWVERPVTSWIANFPPKRQNKDCHKTKCCRFPNNGRCRFCEEHCHPT